MRMVRPFATAVAAAMALAACVPRTAPPAPVPAPPPQPAPQPVPAAPAQQPPVAWQDGPLSQGDWGYDSRLEPRAVFGAEGPIFVARCAPPRQVSLARIGVATGSTLTISTTFGERSLPASNDGRITSATLAAADPLLDEMAFSRGRFLVQAGEQPDLVLPTWPELARLVEECRQ